MKIYIEHIIMQLIKHRSVCTQHLRPSNSTSSRTALPYPSLTHCSHTLPFKEGWTWKTKKGSIL